MAESNCPKKDARGRWVAAWTPLGQGMVKLPEFFHMIAAMQFAGPTQLHFEYPLGGAEDGKKDIQNKDEVFASMRRDLEQLRSYLAEARL